MKVLRIIRNYFCYCGIEPEEFRKVKKDAYVSNFEVWRILHLLMDFAFGALFLSSLFNDFMAVNRWFYMGAFIYSLVATAFFFVLKKDSLVGQLLIYLSMSLLLFFGALITQNKPDIPAISFIAFLLLSPLFMIDKPFFMAIELTVASTIFLIWMYNVKPYEVWQMDLVDTIIYTIVGIFIHIIVNSFRIREFVLIRKINIQKDLDDLTGLKNKGALTREINAFVKSSSKNLGLFYVLDIDYFKSFNDTYGHDIGDEILAQLGAYLRGKFVNNEIVGRFGGDEFIIFIKDTDDKEYASKIASEISQEVGDKIMLPSGERFSVSLGIAIYQGEEKNYSEVFKKADIALYQTKANRKSKFNINE